MLNRRSVIGIPLLIFFFLISAPAAAEEQTWQNLHYGNNFLSFHVLPEDPSLEGVFQEKLEWVSQVIGEGTVAYKLEDGSWIGNLTEVTRTGAYFVFFDLPMGVASPFTHTIEGTVSDPDIQFDLHTGINWVAYPHSENTAIQAGIPDAIENLFTKVIGEGTSTIQTGSGWVGALQSFLPGYGYKIEVTEDVENFQFGCSGCDGVSEYTYGCTDSFATNYDAEAEIGDKSCTYNVPEDWKPTPGGGQAFYILHKLTINGAPLQADDVVGAFHNGVNVGFGFPQGEFVTIAALSLNDGDEVSFVIHDTSTGEDHPVDTSEPLEWADSAIEILGCKDAEKSNFSDIALFGLENCSDECVPKNCEELEAQCGLPEDGCGIALDCGTCAEGSACSDTFICEVICVPATCEDLGAGCGAPDDGCGEPLDCGICEEQYACSEAFECVCDAEECMEMDTTSEEDVEETDASDWGCDPNCAEEGCTFTCIDNAIYTCESDTWELVEDCNESGTTCELVAAEGESPAQLLCTGGSEEVDASPSEDTAEEPAEEDTSEEPAQDTSEEEEEEEETEEATEEDAGEEPATDTQEEEAEETIEASDDGCGSCSVKGSSNGIPPRGGLFLFLAATLALIAGRRRALRSN